MASNRNKLTIGMKSARKKFDAGDFEGAIASYTEAINRRLADKRILDLVDKNRLAEAYNSCGFIKNNLGRNEEAIADYEEAIDLNPADKKILALAYNGRGSGKNELGRNEEAFADLDEAIRLDPELAAAWNNRGSVKSGLGRHEEALEDLDNAIRLDSTKAIVWSNRGSAKNELGRYEETLADLDEAIRLDPEYAIAWSNRGSAKNELGRYEEALADLDEAIRLDPEYAIAWSNRGSAKNELGRYEEGLADLDEAIRLDPEYAIAWNNRGSVKADIQRFDDAIKDVEKALNLLPKDPEFRNNLAAIKAEQSAREAIEKRIGALEADTDEVKGQAEEYKRKERINRSIAYAVMAVLAGTISSLITVLVAPNLRPEFLSELGTINSSDPFGLLPWITIIFLMTSPLVWAIRLLLAEANSAKIMQAEYRHLALVERRMFVYFAKDDTDEGKQIRADYIKATMTNSPADKLVALQNKANAPSPNFVETIRSKIIGKSSS